MTVSKIGDESLLKSLRNVRVGAHNIVFLSQTMDVYMQLVLMILGSLVSQRVSTTQWYGLFCFF